MANYNPNLVKIHRSYTIEEAASVFGIHKNTVSQWVKKGLPCMTERKPYLILGADLKLFLKRRREANKQTCRTDEIYCVSCRKPSKPAENFVEYIPQSSKAGRLVALCSCCEHIIQKIVNVERLSEYDTLFELSIPKALKQLNDRGKPLLNSDFT